ncbi:MAG: hypothetical protein QME21_00885 [Anaerolineales bacterium]|jgi:hypothetical protein|nr:hypothetical protein [Anaerolineales bacterium]
MAKPKFDGVVEAVHYNSDGKVKWVRAYVRRGAIFSDRVLIERQALIDQIKAGKNFVTGKRLPMMGGTFEVDKPVRIAQNNGKEVLTTGEPREDRDHLDGVPVI